MNFFLPYAESTEQAERVYSGIRESAESQSSVGAKLDNRRVYYLAGIHNGKAFEAKVGHSFEVLREVVIAILHDASRNLYLVCTPSRGVAQGTPYLVGASEVGVVRDFDPEPVPVDRARVSETERDGRC